MEEKESTVSASPGNSEPDSPPVVSNAVPTQAVSAAVAGAAEGAAVFGSVSTASATAFSVAGSGTTSHGNVDSLGKKKRGRPRKYDANGNLNLSYARVTAVQSQTTPFSLSLASPSEFSSSSSKRGKGRPPGSGCLFAKKMRETEEENLGLPGWSSVRVNLLFLGNCLQAQPVGISRLMWVPEEFVFSLPMGQFPTSPFANRALLAGRFEILSLSGSFTVQDTNTGRNRTGGLSVSLAGPDGRVIGGGIAGLLTAASPIQIVVGSFTPNGYKVHKRKYQKEHILASPPPPAAPDRLTVATPISQARPKAIDPCYPTPPCLPAQTQVEPEKNNTADKENPNGSLHFAGWNGSDARVPDHGQSPDINVCVPGE
ncbi:hypothetical protein TIFTF001_008566 [Ficus carica]|uniref:AT-hook motif nuclear-localized protein n=1 Tax=Ficus carica TaxID=3494 RepID=A0AA87ZTN4_FICCA|nr:hypothetical protein TIFTF001_008566 [Ficus carica]